MVIQSVVKIGDSATKQTTTIFQARNEKDLKQERKTSLKKLGGDKFDVFGGFVD